MTGDLSRALSLLEGAEKLVPVEPFIVSLLGVYHALALNPDHDPCLRNVQPLPEFQVLVSALQSNIPTTSPSSERLDVRLELKGEKTKVIETKL